MTWFWVFKITDHRSQVKVRVKAAAIRCGFKLYEGLLVSDYNQDNGR